MAAFSGNSSTISRGCQLKGNKLRQLWSQRQLENWRYNGRLKAYRCVLKEKILHIIMSADSHQILDAIRRNYINELEFRICGAQSIYTAYVHIVQIIQTSFNMTYAIARCEKLVKSTFSSNSHVSQELPLIQETIMYNELSSIDIQNIPAVPINTEVRAYYIDDQPVQPAPANLEQAMNPQPVPGNWGQLTIQSEHTAPDIAASDSTSECPICYSNIEKYDMRQTSCCKDNSICRYCVGHILSNTKKCPYCRADLTCQEQ